jgi:hypothetical protein
LPSRTGKKKQRTSFAFRVKMGEYEVEINGEHEDVLNTIKEMPRLMANVHKAFESLKPKTTATLTVKKAAAKEKAPARKYPQILRARSCSEAILKALETDWGKWRPRTVSELKEALKANDLRYRERTFSGVLTRLVKKGKLRHWKTDAGYVYILAEQENLA